MENASRRQDPSLAEAALPDAASGRSLPATSGRLTDLAERAVYSARGGGLDGATGMIESLRIACRVFLPPGRRAGWFGLVLLARAVLASEMVIAFQEDRRISRASR